MAKINLLTIHWGNCFGAVMQTYATKKLLEEHGHQVVIINLIPRSTTKQLFEIKRILKLYFIPDLKYRYFKYRYFGKMSKLMYAINPSKIPDADYTIVGSDQTWNPNITQEFRDSFFLDFVKKGKKVSFASSFGNDTFIGDKVKTTHFLNDFTAISVRENTGVSILKDIFHIDAVQLPDPTLAYGRYNLFFGKRKPIYKPYIFCYLLKNTKAEKDISSFVSNRLNIELYKNTRWSGRFSVGPLETLKKIYNASFVIVSSFHGLAFSLMFHKKFIVLCADGNKFTRLSSLLKLVNLEDRYIHDLQDLKTRIEILDKEIPYDEVDAILNFERERVHKFISENIK